MPSRQYAPKRARTAEFGVDGAYHAITGTPATRRLVSSLIVCNTTNTVDANVSVWFGTAAPAGGNEGLRVTAPHHASATYLSHAEIAALTLAPGWGIWYRVNSGANCTVEAHYLEEFTGAPINYDPKCLWVNASTAWSAAIAASAKRRIITSVNGCVIAGGDSSFRLWCGPSAPGTFYAAPRWAGLNPANPTNFMSTLGVPMHLDSGDALWVYGDTANNYLQINYMEEQSVAANLQALWRAYMTHVHDGIGTPWRPAPIAGQVQAGTIVLWNGSVGSIPAGWVLCNGANGTPDMRNRFIRSTGGAYGEGGAGGTDTHNFVHGHTVPVSVGAAGDHYHTTSQTGGFTGNEVWATDTNSTGGIGAHSHVPVTTSWGGNHGHGVTGNSAGAALGPVDNRPYFYTLAFIMKT